MIARPIRTLKFREPPQATELLDREWLVTNGLGGYAAGSLCGIPTRRFHSWLVAALPAPLGRTTMLNRLIETVTLPGGQTVALGGEDGEKGLVWHEGSTLVEFRLESGLPVWTYAIGGFVLERRATLVHKQNTVHITYSLLEGDGSLGLRVRPALCFRPHEGPVEGPASPYSLLAVGDRYEISAGPGAPTLRLIAVGETAAFAADACVVRMNYELEESRGYDHVGTLASPGYFDLAVSKEKRVTLVASTEAWSAVLALSPEEAWNAELHRRDHLLDLADPRARRGIAAELVLAADQFVITPATRLEETARAQATGHDVRTIIAGYHWFTDWGRDTMISLEGLTLLTGRAAEAKAILRTFAHYVRDGLIPNMFPEGKNEGLYHTADATLWFFHAVSRYAAITGDDELVSELVPTFCAIADAHIRGTRFGIGVDPKDGLLRQGAEGYQLTWMDAKVDDWVVTPRRGKAVEINALFYNALMLLSEWLSATGDAAKAAPYAAAAERARASFNARFWYAAGRHLYDVVDGEQGDDSACRPNQLFAISLPHPILAKEHHGDVLDVCERELLTPVGLRSLSPQHPDYKRLYSGDLRTRDAAYHQGTVWAWLIGPFIDAYRKVKPQDLDGATRALSGFAAHLNEACVGSVSEVFDADAPFAPRGCVAQAWSVAELLRCTLALDQSAPTRREPA